MALRLPGRPPGVILPRGLCMPLRYDSFLGGGGGVPPAGDSHWANVVFLCGFESDPPADESDSAHGNGTLAGDAAISASSPLVGTSSLALDGTGDYVYWADSPDWTMTGELTIDVVFKFSSLPDTFNVLIAQWDPTGNNRAWEIGAFSDDTLNFLISVDGVSSSAATLAVAGGWQTGVQYHARATRDASDVIRVALDGTVGATTAIVSGMRASSVPMTIGANDHGSGGSLEFPGGKIDEVRITKGVARQISEVVTLPFPRFAA